MKISVWGFCFFFPSLDWHFFFDCLLPAFFVHVRDHILLLRYIPNIYLIYCTFLSFFLISPSIYLSTFPLPIHQLIQFPSSHPISTKPNTNKSTSSLNQPIHQNASLPDPPLHRPPGLRRHRSSRRLPLQRRPRLGAVRARSAEELRWCMFPSIFSASYFARQ